MKELDAEHRARAARRFYEDMAKSEDPKARAFFAATEWAIEKATPAQLQLLNEWEPGKASKEVLGLLSELGLSHKPLAEHKAWSEAVRRVYRLVQNDLQALELIEPGSLIVTRLG